MNNVIRVVAEGYLAFKCPGCQCAHKIRYNTDQHPYWNWNGDLVKPTIAPSIKVTWEYGEERTKKICHSFVRDGKIQFLGDCTHELAGQTVALPLWPNDSLN